MNFNLERGGQLSGRVMDESGSGIANADVQIFIDSGQYDRAIALLQDWKGRTEWSSYAKFNLGVALVRAGHVEAAMQPVPVDDVRRRVVVVGEQLGLRERQLPVGHREFAYRHSQDGN